MEEYKCDDSLFRTVVEKAPVLVFLYREEFLYVNPYARKVLGHSMEELKRKKVWEILTEKEREPLKKVIEKRLRGKEIERRYKELTVITKSGGEKKLRLYATTVRWKEQFAGLAVGIDVTREYELELKLHREKEKFLKRTLYDSITGLPSRVLFEEKLKEVLSYAKRRKEITGVILLDIKHFKEINLVYGSKNGDRVLRKVGKRLKEHLREGDIVSRFYADQFGITLTGIREIRYLDRAVLKIQDAFEKPFRVDGQSLRVEAWGGIAIFPKDGTQPEELIRKAELALGKARDKETVNFSYYSEEIEEEVKIISVIRHDLAQAFKEKQIEVFYQPVMDIREGRTAGIEALIRWNHPELGIIPPFRLIPVAEDSGLINRITRSVLATATKDLRKLIDAGYNNLWVSVNFSPKQFRDPELPTIIMKEIDKKGIPPSRFVLEITESTAMTDPETTSGILKQIREEGIKIAIDDFGTGYSSMNYLIEFEVDKIKIDRSFIELLEERKQARSVVRAVVDLSHSIGAKAVAEGIETEGQRNFLREIGCDEGQGFLYSPPLNFRDLLIYLKRENERFALI